MNINMSLEIEKKYLLKSLPFVKYNEVYDITQYYIGGDRYRMQYNHKSTQTSFFKTTKTFISAGINEEVEIKISAADYWSNMSNAERAIKKTRHIVKTKKYKWELDVFKDLSIVIAEVEVPNEKTLKKIKVPSWLEPVVMLDVTEYKQFSNYNLAQILE